MSLCVCVYIGSQLIADKSAKVNRCRPLTKFTQSHICQVFGEHSRFNPFLCSNILKKKSLKFISKLYASRLCQIFYKVIYVALRKSDQKTTIAYSHKFCLVLLLYRIPKKHTSSKHTNYHCHPLTFICTYVPPITTYATYLPLLTSHQFTTTVHCHHNLWDICHVTLIAVMLSCAYSVMTS